MDTSKNHILGVCILALALGSSGWMVYRDYSLRHAQTMRDVTRGASIREWRSLADSGTVLRRGTSDAPLILVFSDYECPACRRLERSLDSLWQERPERFTEVLRHYPLSIHPNAVNAAIAAECAATIGVLPALTTRLFAEQDSLTKPRIREALAQVAPTPARAKAGICFDEAQTASRVMRDARLAKSLKLAGTPAFVIGGAVYYGGFGVDSMRQFLGLGKGK